MRAAALIIPHRNPHIRYNRLTARNRVFGIVIQDDIRALAARPCQQFGRWRIGSRTGDAQLNPKTRSCLDPACCHIVTIPNPGDDLPVQRTVPFNHGL